MWHLEKGRRTGSSPVAGFRRLLMQMGRCRDRESGVWHEASELSAVVTREKDAGRRIIDAAVSSRRQGSGAEIDGVSGSQCAVASSISLDGGEFDYFGPFLCFVCNEFTEVAGRACKRLSAKISKEGFHSRVGKAGINFLVEPINDCGRRIVGAPTPHQGLAS
jgi:hypothetical protein